ncbi:hypothetical protein CRUP_010662 [Coryphaenoides rupestris]|nr:hypothetical protein CRUP_010662 [Coryphaenoides rupestris]
MVVSGLGHSLLEHMLLDAVCPFVITCNSTLEEITEQEESDVSLIPSPCSDTQDRDQTRLSLSADVSMEAPPPGAPFLDSQGPAAPPPATGTSGDQPGDLSTDGKSTQSTVMHATQVPGVETGAAESGPAPVVTQRLEASMDESPQPSTPPPPNTQPDVYEAKSAASARDSIQTPGVETEGQEASVGSNAESGPATVDTTQLREASVDESLACPTPPPPTSQPDAHEGIQTPEVETWKGLECSVASNSPLLEPTGEPADHLPPLPAPAPPPPPQQLQECDDRAAFTDKPSASAPPRLKRDVAIEKEAERPHLEPSLPHTDGPPVTAPLATSLHGTDSEPRPRPANELTRDYIPKVGMTTYTIVPPKSLEKLRYFEVELTLEPPPPPPAPVGPEQDTQHVVPPPPEGHASQTEQKAAPTPGGTTDMWLPREHSAGPSDTTAVSAPPLPPATNSPLTGDAILSSSPTNHGDVKQVKVPPMTKPKPGSFRLPQHKHSPGYYVTSAGLKKLSTLPGACYAEAPGNLERAMLPPPPSPPLSPPPPAEEEEEKGTERRRKRKRRKRKRRRGGDEEEEEKEEEEEEEKQEEEQEEGGGVRQEEEEEENAITERRHLA